VEEGGAYNVIKTDRVLEWFDFSGFSCRLLCILQLVLCSSSQAAAAAAAADVCR
jgi:hypothetical protein